MNHFKVALIFPLLVALSYPVSAQKTSLLFSKSLLNKTGKSISVELTDSLGNSPVSADFFNKSDLIFFTVKPIPGQDWTFSKNDSEKKVTELKLIQNKVVLPVIHLKNILEKEDIKSIVLAYNKSAMSVFQSFRFQFEALESESILIPETLWPNYREYSAIIDKTKMLVGTNEAFGSFKNVIRLWTIDSNFSKFSFYQPSIEMFNKIIEKNNSQTTESFQKSVSTFRKNSSEKNLDNLLLLKDSLVNNLNEILAFLKTSHEGVVPEEFTKTIESQKSKIANDVTEANRLFRKTMLSIFEVKGYEDYRYKLYTEVLARLLITVDKIMPLNSLDNLYISKLKKFPVLKSELTDMGWNEDFATICRLLNDNIHDHFYLFNDTAMIKYAQNKIMEPQPYYTLFDAYNKLIKKEKEPFVSLLNQCLTTVTDRNLLSGLDLNIALANMDTIRNEEFWLVVQKGYDAQVNGAYQEAKKYYDKAEKLSVSNEVLFFLSGENSYKLNDRFSSEIYFNRALAINPKFINPKLFRIEFLTEDKDYETALQLVNEALDANPIWYFYLKKAILLQLQAKNEEAKSILLSNCIPMNSFNYEQYIILGDIYLALNDVKNARESFMIAGNLNPNDKQYKKRMELLKQISEKSPESAPEPNR